MSHGQTTMYALAQANFEGMVNLHAYFRLWEEAVNLAERPYEGTM